MQKTKPSAVDSGLQLAERFCSNLGYGKLFSASITVQNMLPRTFPQANLLPQPVYSMSPSLTSEKTVKENGLQSTEKIVVGITYYYT